MVNNFDCSQATRFNVNVLPMFTIVAVHEVEKKVIDNDNGEETVCSLKSHEPHPSIHLGLEGLSNYIRTSHKVESMH